MSTLKKILIALVVLLLLAAGINCGILSLFCLYCI